MFYRFYKTIHNHYSKFFKIFYFLRYLIPIFLVAIILYISIPKLFDLEKKTQDIKIFLLKNYQLKLDNYTSVKYNIFPLPNISLENVNLQFYKNSNYIKAKKVFIYLNLNKIYKKKFSAQKISIINNKIALEIKDIEYLFNFVQDLKANLQIKNLNLDLTTKDNSVLKLDNINFSNYGFNKNRYKGKVFDKNFEFYVNSEKKSIKFKILKTGIKANLKFNEYKKNKLVAGTSKINILNNYLKLDYLIQKDKMIINKSKFRNKDLSFSFNNLITLNPYFEMETDVKIEKINNKLFSKLNLNELLSQKKIIKKLNGINRIEYKEKKILQYNLIKEFNSQINLENGRMNENNKIKFHGATADCRNEFTLLDDIPRLYFRCNIKIIDTKEFRKYFSISKKFINQSLSIYLKGSINLSRNKINFEKINISEIGYIANEEDKFFFKKVFEEILLTEGFFNIFKTQKIKNFINEII